MNEKMIYGVVGLILGIVLVNSFNWNKHENYNNQSGMSMMHRMPDGTMMGTSGDMNEMMMNMMSGLAGKTGDDFDKAFLSEMIVHHQGAVDMAREVLAKSKRPELTKLANDIISTQTKEIEMMKGWEKSWFK